MDKRDNSWEEVRDTYLSLDDGEKSRVHEFILSLLKTEYNQQRSVSSLREDQQTND